MFLSACFSTAMHFYVAYVAVRCFFGLSSDCRRECSIANGPLPPMLVVYIFDMVAALVGFSPFPPNWTLQDIALHHVVGIVFVALQLFYLSAVLGPSVNTPSAGCAFSNYLLCSFFFTVTCANEGANAALNVLGIIGPSAASLMRPARLTQSVICLVVLSIAGVGSPLTGFLTLTEFGPRTPLLPRVVQGAVATTGALFSVIFYPGWMMAHVKRLRRCDKQRVDMY